MARGSAATTRSTSMARADENWPAGAAPDRGRGASHGVTATTTTSTTSATMSAGEQVTTSAHDFTVAGGRGFATTTPRRRLPHEGSWTRAAADRRRPVSSSSPAACACTTCAPARDRPVVYVHGAKGSVYDFTLSVGTRLAERYAAVAMDRPGSGSAARPAKGENSPQAQAAVLRAAAAELGLERPILLGHSLGAAVALAWALDAPDDVAAVVTLCGYVLPLGGPPPWVVALLRSPHRAPRRGRPRPLPPRAPAGRERRAAGLLPRRPAARVRARRAATGAGARQPHRRRRGPQVGRGGPGGPRAPVPGPRACRW